MSINLDDLTLGQIKQLQNLSPGNQATSMYTSYKGKWVICRTRNEGVNFGQVKDCDDTGVILTYARRLWRVGKGAQGGFWYEGVANEGPSDTTEMSQAIAEKVIAEDYSLTLCSDDAAGALINADSKN